MGEDQLERRGTDQFWGRERGWIPTRARTTTGSGKGQVLDGRPVWPGWNGRSCGSQGGGEDDDGRGLEERSEGRHGELDVYVDDEDGTKGVIKIKIFVQQP
jgi:hypothetical protein